MQKFHNILFVSHGIADESEALKQALSLARNNKAALKALLICPALPAEMVDYKDKYEASLKDQIIKSIKASRDAVKVSDADVPVQIEVASGDRPTVRIIHHVLRNTHDLIIKEVEPKSGGKGFKAIDMELLRKSPCPVWLCRPIKQHRDKIRVAVAIDPQSKVPEGHDLSLRLLTLSRSLADTCNGELNIIACWDYELERYFRDNIWIKMEDEELRQTVLTAKQQDLRALKKLVSSSQVSGKMQVHHLKGRPEQIIPKYIKDKKIDILVMGTVARTGVPGFVIGNTAENVLQKIDCTLMALKPNGFVSPVKAY